MTIPVILVGGFLGAGKTTLLLTTAQRLAARGLRVGLVTNDQGENLVDTALAQRSRLAVVEVSGGCFCCRYPDMVKALMELHRQTSPDVILAEPVGSCTDLMATVIRPLLHQHARRFRLAPLTIAVDPLRAQDRFLPEIDYLIQQQVAEAEVVVLTKQDLPAAIEHGKTTTSQLMRHGDLRIFPLSAKTGVGIDAWLDSVLNTTTAADRKLDVDYSIYAAGEAALGWLNASGKVSASQPFSATNWVQYLLQMLERSLSLHQSVIAHIKVYASTPEADCKASLMHAQGPIGWDLRPDNAYSSELTFTLNARVQAAPELLASTVRSVLHELSPHPDFDIQFTSFECFQPEAPNPTHRI
jgi:G3E family GTPase